MKVQELLELLRPFPPDTLVIVAEPPPFAGALALENEPGVIPAVILWPSH